MSRRGTKSTSRYLAFAMFAALSLILSACGGDNGDEEPTATTEPSSAQPTVEATVDVVSTPEPNATIADSGAPAHTDMSSPLPDDNTPVAEGTPESGGESARSDQATAAISTPVLAVDDATATSAVTGNELLTPNAAEAEADSSAAESTPENEIIDDGTGGAANPEAIVATATAPEPDTDVSAPVATPGAAASPVASLVSALATPQASGEPLLVTSCTVEDVPEFTGEDTLYRLSVDMNFRSGPGTDCDLVSDVPLGEFTAVEIIGGPVDREGDDSGEWVEVEVGDQVGWLALQFLEPAE